MVLPNFNPCCLNSVPRKLAKVLFIAMAVCLTTHHTLSIAEDEVDDPFTTLLVSPAGEPVPALKYDLLPPPAELLPGNAATIYLRATKAKGEEFRKKMGEASDWLRQPLEEFNVEEARKYLRQVSGVFDYLDRAARRESCDWEYPLGEEPAIMILLPDVQEMRSLARLLAVKARLEIVEGRFDDAIHTLQTGYALGQHDAKTPFLVCKLVGIAITNIMSERLSELIRQENAPNMYWALTKLPRPLFSIRDAIDTEGRSLELTFSIFENLDKLHSVESIQQEFDDSIDMLSEFSMATAMEKIFGVPMGDAQEVLMAVSLTGYPKARRFLIEEQGLSAEVVDAMPVAQVVFLYSRDVYNIIRDEKFKLFYVDYNQDTVEKFDKKDKYIFENARSMEIIPFAQTFLPTIQGSLIAQNRIQRQIEALRVVEAVRMQAADNGGTLPVSLDDITVVPVPKDPLLQRPFTYQVQDSEALLTTQAPKKWPNDRIRYRIILRKTDK